MSHGKCRGTQVKWARGLKSDIPSSEDGTPGSALISPVFLTEMFILLRDQVLTWSIHIEVVGIYNCGGLAYCYISHIATKLYNWCERHGSLRSAYSDHSMQGISENYPPESIFHIALQGNALWRIRALSFTQIPVVLTSHHSSPIKLHFSWELSILTRNWNNGQYRHQRRKWRWLKNVGKFDTLPRSDSVILKVASVWIFIS